jgi:hypothetical protein
VAPSASAAGVSTASAPATGASATGAGGRPSSSACGPCGGGPGRRAAAVAGRPAAPAGPTISACRVAGVAPGGWRGGRPGPCPAQVRVPGGLGCPRGRCRRGSVGLQRPGHAGPLRQPADGAARRQPRRGCGGGGGARRRCCRGRRGEGGRGRGCARGARCPGCRPGPAHSAIERRHPSRTAGCSGGRAGRRSPRIRVTARGDGPRPAAGAALVTAARLSGAPPVPPGAARAGALAPPAPAPRPLGRHSPPCSPPGCGRARRGGGGGHFRAGRRPGLCRPTSRPAGGGRGLVGASSGARGGRRSRGADAPAAPAPAPAPALPCRARRQRQAAGSRGRAHPRPSQPSGGAPPPEQQADAGFGGRPVGGKG